MKIVQKENAPEVAIEVLAQAIEALADGMKKILDGRVKTDVLIHLVSWKSGVGAGDTRKILDTLADLKSLLKK